MSVDWRLLIIGLVLNSVVAAAARWRRAVTTAGAVAGIIVGSGILFFGGVQIYGMLILFFLSSTGMSRVGRRRKTDLSSIHEKTDERDATQVLANGLAGLAAAILLAATGSTVYTLAAAGAFAAANADTWASELGVLSRSHPRSLVTGERVERGLSGGVTWAGTAASLCGGLVIGIWQGAWLSAELGWKAAWFVLLVAGIGVVGSLVDSILGGTIQARYQRPDGSPTERSHTGERENVLDRGVRAVTNDVVNLVTTLVAGGLSAGIATIIL